MSETPDAMIPDLDEAALAPLPEPKPARRSGGTGRRGSGRASGSGRRSPSTRTPRTPRASAPSTEAAGTLATALRGLVSGIEEEVTNITALSAQVDEHVRALNDLRAEATRRLLHLDDLQAAAEDVNLSAFLDTTIQPQLPQVEEEFPDRIYGG